MPTDERATAAFVDRAQVLDEHTLLPAPRRHVDAELLAAGREIPACRRDVVEPREAGGLVAAAQAAGFGHAFLWFAGRLYCTPPLTKISRLFAAGVGNRTYLNHARLNLFTQRFNSLPRSAT